MGRKFSEYIHSKALEHLEAIKRGRARTKIVIEGGTHRSVYNANRRTLGATWPLLQDNSNTLIGGTLNTVPANAVFKDVDSD